MAERYRNFASVLYPESAPSDWLELLKQERVPFFVSPLHTDNYNPENPEMGNKPHHHVMVMFEGNKTESQARDFFKKSSCVGLEIVKSKVGYARYLCHLDEDNKVHYDIDDVISYGGVDYKAVVECSSDTVLAITEMEFFCEEHNVDSYYLLCRYATMHRPDWSRMLRNSCSYYMKEWLKSKAWSLQNGRRYILDSTGTDLITGEYVGVPDEEC